MNDTPSEYQIEPQQLLFAGNAYFNIINSLKSPNTKTTYIQCLKQYMQHRKAKTVDELLVGDQRLLLIYCLIVGLVSAILSILIDGLRLLSMASFVFASITVWYMFGEKFHKWQGRKKEQKHV